jgi:hypothetical protein
MPPTSDVSSRIWGILKGVQERINVSFQFGYSPSNNSPHSLVEHFAILVCQDIPETDDTGPWDIGFCSARFLREMSRSFTYNHELALDGKSNQLAFFKTFVSQVLHERENVVTGLRNVP